MTKSKEERIKRSTDDLFEAVLRWEKGQYDDDKLKLNFVVHLRMLFDNGYTEGYNDCEKDTEEVV